MLKFQKNGTVLDKFLIAQQYGYAHGCPLQDGIDELMKKHKKQNIMRGTDFPNYLAYIQ